METSTVRGEAASLATTDPDGALAALREWAWAWVGNDTCTPWHREAAALFEALDNAGRFDIERSPRG